MKSCLEDTVVLTGDAAPVLGPTNQWMYGMNAGTEPSPAGVATTGEHLWVFL